MRFVDWGELARGAARGTDPDNAAKTCLSAKRPSHFPGISNTSHPLTDRPAHGDLARSRSDSAPSMRDVRDRAGEDWPEWVSSRWRRSTSPTNFFIFSPPPEIPVSCPRTQARLSHRPASLPVSPVRGDAPLRFAARPGTTPLFEPSRLPPPRWSCLPSVRAQNLGFLRRGTRKPCPEILSLSIVTFVKPASP